MVKFKKVASLVIVSTCFLTTLGFASGGGAELESADIDPSNINSLQRGAANFMNYCSGCHSAKYVRFNKLQKDLQLTEEQVTENLMFAAKKTTELMHVAMPVDGALIPLPPK